MRRIAAFRSSACATACAGAFAASLIATPDGASRVLGIAQDRAAFIPGADFTAIRRFPTASAVSW